MTRKTVKDTAEILLTPLLHIFPPLNSSEDVITSHDLFRAAKESCGNPSTSKKIKSFLHPSNLDIIGTAAAQAE